MAKESDLLLTKLKKMREENIELRKVTLNGMLTVGKLENGHDGRYYFVFSLPAELVDELPDELVRQALAIAQKVNALIINKEETL